MTSERVIIDGWGRKQCRHRVPDSIDHLRIERAHDVGRLHSVVVGWVHPESKRDKPTTGGWPPRNLAARKPQRRQRAAARSQLSRRRAAPAPTRQPGTPNVTRAAHWTRTRATRPRRSARRSVRVAVGHPVTAAHTERRTDGVTRDQGARAATRLALGTELARPCAGHPSFRRRSGGLSFRTSSAHRRH